MEPRTADEALKIFGDDNTTDRNRMQNIINTMFDEIKHELETNEAASKYFLEKIVKTGKTYYICWQSKYKIASCFTCNFTIYSGKDIKWSYDSLCNKAHDDNIRGQTSFFGKLRARLSDVKYPKIEQIETGPFVNWHLVITKIVDWNDFDRRDKFGIVLKKNID